MDIFPSMDVFPRINVFPRMEVPCPPPQLHGLSGQGSPSPFCHLAWVSTTGGPGASGEVGVPGSVPGCGRAGAGAMVNMVLPSSEVRAGIKEEVKAGVTAKGHGKDIQHGSRDIQHGSRPLQMLPCLLCSLLLGMKPWPVLCGLVPAVPAWCPTSMAIKESSPGAL